MQYETKNVIVTGSRTMRIYAIGTPNDHFEIHNDQVVTCWSADTDLNSAPTVTKIINYIINQYDVDLSNIIE